MVFVPAAHRRAGICSVRTWVAVGLWAAVGHFTGRRRLAADCFVDSSGKSRALQGRRSAPRRTRQDCRHRHTSRRVRGMPQQRQPSSTPKTVAPQPPSVRNTSVRQPSSAPKATGKPSCRARPNRPLQRSGHGPSSGGPDRTGISLETGLLKQWPRGGAALAWKTPGLGTGNGAPSVAGGRISG